MSDPLRRGAARTATLVALPVTLLAGLGVHQLLRPAAEPAAVPAAAAPTPSAVPDTPVPMAARPLAGRAAALCRDLLAQLPARARDLPRRTVTAGPAQNAAYGEPPLTLACGTPPAVFPATTQLLRLDGVCWYGRGTPAGSAWTTVDRAVPVTLTVPPPADGAAQRVIDFSAPVVGAVPAVADPPPGCRDLPPPGHPAGSPPAPPA
ncbi:hypothetical protein GCM10010124_21290 [Pilimelia terevasa]|uniref:DUF3515 domain-containing protein n=1 Tax=Pilimelia terevasa TaxID=53372 RepID=A0A8J3BRL3_9ACTN|nr:DUF3515 domain-containing protein [Pilimelia terevasa]GGK28427.1 hypothetical protein GCM10010124_21290 [Pilimelia terevasa]